MRHSLEKTASSASCVCTLLDTGLRKSAPIAEAARKGLMVLCVQVGLAVLQATMENEVTGLVGPKGKHRAHRQACRHGYEPGWAVMAGCKVRLERPRVRRKGGGEIRLESYAWAQQEDSLNEAVLARLLHGVATRSYAATLEDVGEVESFGTSKSRVGARFIRQMDAKLREHLSRRLDDLTVVALAVDGARIDEWTIVVVLGVDTEGRKHVLGLREGAMENEAVSRSVLEDVVERGLRYEQGLLVVIDGVKTLRAAVRAAFDKHGVVQRCTVRKKRNVLDHLLESEKRWVGRKLTQAYREPDYAEAKAALERLAEQPEVQHPGAAVSLREGLEETLTLHRLGILGLLHTSPSSTNLVESALSFFEPKGHRVKRWRSGQQAERWVGMALLYAESHFRRLGGYRLIPMLQGAPCRDLGLEKTKPQPALAAG
ncbi:IS256 family transposase [Candidatus Methylacidithermus pantelleriae]|uniref:Mutator family transposase n=1 Tax=Candidatus Methylacidithermus pantelleriae TaxID=2744239 RepID=A0A8J2BNJ5_9BACT|nr:IS256 family transposase [Candidatus Methylacidithermus pantelleriae]CAF0705088.1 transposase [Candidatus Methylacidithermus pantelleriae]